MKIDNNHMRELIEKYFEGNTSLEEENMLRNFLKDKKTWNDHPEIAEIFAMYQALEEIQADQTVNFQGMASDVKGEMEPLPPREDPVPSGYIQFRWVYGLAAGFSLLVTGLALGLFLAGQNAVTDADIASMQSDILEMKQMVALSRLQNESPSERIMATYEVKSFERADADLINALISTLDNDQDVNVRIAAAEALYKFGNSERVRMAMLKTLTGQKEPVLQIKIIDMLVRMNEKRAIPELQKVIQNQDQMSEVRDKAAQGMAILL